MAIDLDSSFSGHTKRKTITHLASRLPPMLRRLSPEDLDAMAAVGGGVHGPGGRGEARRGGVAAAAAELMK